MKTHTKINLADKSEVNSLVAQIERTLEQACRSYEFANDGAISEEDRNFYEARRQRLMNEVESILFIYGITCDWPGLYPTFSKGNKRDHNLLWILTN